MDDSKGHGSFARSVILCRRFSEIESGSSGIPPGCEILSFRDPGVSSLALLDPRLISVTPPGVKTRPVRVLSRDDAKPFRFAIRECRRLRSSTPS